MMGVSDTYNSDMGSSAGILIRGHCSSGVVTIPLKSVGLGKTLKSSAIVKVYEKPQPKHTNPNAYIHKSNIGFAR